MTTAQQMGKKSQQIQKKKYGKGYKAEMTRRSKVRDDILARLTIKDSIGMDANQRQRVIKWLEGLPMDFMKNGWNYAKNYRATIYK